MHPPGAFCWGEPSRLNGSSLCVVHLGTWLTWLTSKYPKSSIVPAPMINLLLSAVDTQAVKFVFLPAIWMLKEITLKHGKSCWLASIGPGNFMTSIMPKKPSRSSEITERLMDISNSTLHSNASIPDEGRGVIQTVAGIFNLVPWVRQSSWVSFLWLTMNSPLSSCGTWPFLEMDRVCILSATILCVGWLQSGSAVFLFANSWPFCCAVECILATVYTTLPGGDVLMLSDQTWCRRAAAHLCCVQVDSSSWNSLDFLRTPWLQDLESCIIHVRSIFSFSSLFRNHSALLTVSFQFSSILDTWVTMLLCSLLNSLNVLSRLSTFLCIFQSEVNDPILHAIASICRKSWKVRARWAGLVVVVIWFWGSAVVMVVWSVSRVRIFSSSVKYPCSFDNKPCWPQWPQPLHGHLLQSSCCQKHRC